MSRTNHARKGSVARYKYCKGPGDSWGYEKRIHNRRVRRDGDRVTRDYYRLNEILFSGYPLEENALEWVVVTKRPWVD